MRVILIDTVAPDRPNGSMRRYGQMVQDALALPSSEPVVVSCLQLAPTQAMLDRWPARLRTPVRYLCIAGRAHRLLPRQRDAILHLLDGSHAYMLAGMRKLRCPLVITIHDVIPLLCTQGVLPFHRPGRLGSWLIRLAARQWKRADRVVAVSRNTKRDLALHADIVAERTDVVYSAVQGQNVSGASSDQSDRYILHVAGNNTVYKNRKGVMDVFRIILQSESVRLVMAGAPPDGALLAAVQQAGLEDRVSFQSNLSDGELAGLYRQAAFLLFPSRYEGFGWPPLEAMQAGCPVICSNAGSLPEIVGDAAWIADPDDVATLAQYGLRLLREPDARARLVDAGSRQVETFTLENMGVEIRNCYGLLVPVEIGKAP